MKIFFIPECYKKVIASIQKGKCIYLFGRLNNFRTNFNIEGKGVLEDFSIPEPWYKMRKVKE
jgi:hypothetical protein